MLAQQNNSVVILTALPVEFEAVRSHLSEVEEAVHPQGSIYDVGKFSSSSSAWDVAIVETGAGNSPAAIEAERAIRYFGPSHVLFVGVAGGIKDVKLGDVVAATKVYGYESGKADTEFKPRADIGTPAYPMIQRARASARRREWLKRVQRLDSESQAQPKAYVGPIVAGEKVISSTNSPTFQLIKSNYSDALAVEMEGLGILKAVHANHEVQALVIRGISDMIDGKAEADATGSQERASQHAAAFAFEVLAKLGSHRKTQNNSPSFGSENAKVNTATKEQERPNISVNQVIGDEVVIGTKIVYTQPNNKPTESNASSDSHDPLSFQERTELVQRLLATQKLDLHTTLLQQILTNQEAIKQGLGLDRPQGVIRQEIQTSIESQRPDMFKANGLCAGRPLFPALDQFFVAQAFGANREDLLLALGGAFRDYNLTAYRVDQDIEPGHILCKIAAKLQSTLFGVFELTRTQNRNVYLELGIALGLRRPFVLLKEAEAEVSPLTEGLDYYNIRSYAALERTLGDRMRHYLLNIARYQALDLPQAGSSTTYILAHGDNDMPPDFCLAVAKALSKDGLVPVLLGSDNREVSQVLDEAGIEHRVIDSIGKTRLDATVQAIQAARFGVYRIDAKCSPDTFMVMGIAIGLNRARLLISRKGALLPADVRGLSGLEFRSFVDLAKQFPKRFGDFLEPHRIR